MSKIIIDEIEAKTTDIALTPNGTGNVEITGELVDATLQLNTSTQLNNVKIKTPPNSAGQSHTLILPDNDVEVDKYLKVKSVTGSGSTASGQLEYATIATTDVTNMNADDFTTGTVPSARMPASFPNTSGFALKLIQKYTAPSTVATVNFTGLAADSNFVMIGKNVRFSGATQLEIGFLDTNLQLMSSYNGYNETHSRLAKFNETYDHSSSNFNGYFSYYFKTGGYDGDQGGFIAEFSTDYYSPSMHYRQWHDHYNQSSYSGAGESFLSIDGNVTIGGISLKAGSGSYYIDSPTEIMLYQYIES